MSILKIMNLEAGGSDVEENNAGNKKSGRKRRSCQGHTDQIISPDFHRILNRLKDAIIEAY